MFPILTFLESVRRENLERTVRSTKRLVSVCHNFETLMRWETFPRSEFIVHFTSIWVDPWKARLSCDVGNLLGKSWRKWLPTYPCCVQSNYHLPTWPYGVNDELSKLNIHSFSLCSIYESLSYCIVAMFTTIWTKSELFDESRGHLDCGIKRSGLIGSMRQIVWEILSR